MKSIEKRIKKFACPLITQKEFEQSYFIIKMRLYKNLTKISSIYKT